MLRALLAPRVARPFFWLAWTFSFVMAVLPHPPRLPGEPDDKIQHILAFLTLAMLGSFAFPKLKPWKLVLWLSLFGAVIEVIQMMPMLHRDADVVDWLVDTITTAVVIGVFVWLRARSA